MGAIAFSRQALSGRAMETFIGELLCQCMPPRQQPLAGRLRGYGVWSLRARAGAGEPAQLCYRGALGVDARVYGAGGRVGSRVGRAGKTRSVLCPVEKKRDINARKLWRGIPRPGSWRGLVSLRERACVRSTAKRLRESLLQ